MQTIDKIKTASLVTATVTTGLSAGLFVAYANSVMPGLALADDKSFVVAMNGINVAIINGWFMLSFLGALGFIGLAALLHLKPADRRTLKWIIAGGVLHAAMLMVTFGFNIPLNDQLAAGGTDYAAVRAQFEGSWVGWNLVRALANLGAFGALAWALVLHGAQYVRATVTQAAPAVRAQQPQPVFTAYQAGPAPHVPAQVQYGFPQAPQQRPAYPNTYPVAANPAYRPSL